jgi:hypothetical protein
VGLGAWQRFHCREARALGYLGMGADRASTERSLPGQQSNIDLADRLQDHRILKIA